MWQAGLPTPATSLRIDLCEHRCQEEFSFRVGLHQTYVSSVERGERNVTIGTADRLAKALDTTLADMFSELEQRSNGSGEE